MIPFNPRFSLILAALIITIYTSASAQYYFGQNKVQYNRFDWQLISTPHFDIYFYQGEEQLARTSAVYAEDSYYELSRRYQHEFSKKIPLIVYSSHFHFQETNTTSGFLPEGVGGFTEFLKGRVVMPFNGSYPSFKRILQHELVHAFMIDKIITVFKEHNNYNYYAPPLWFTEGLAEHWSVGWDNEADMFLRDAVLNDYLYPISNIYAVNGSFLMYKEGQSFLNYLEEQYGDYALTRLFQEMWRFDNFYDLFEYIYQIPLAKADENWQYNLRKHYLPLFQEGDLEPFQAIQQTRRGFNFKPALSGSSDSLRPPSFFFLSSRMGYLGIYRKSIQTDTLLQAPDRAELIIKGNLTKEFESFHFMQSKLAVRDSILVFVSRSEDSDVLYFYNYHTRRIRKKKRFDHLIGLFYPAWSHDGQGICFSAVSYAGERDIYYYLHQSDSLIQLTNDFYDDLEPVISPDNRSLIFSSDRGQWGQEGYYHLYLMDLETRTIRELTQGHYNYQSPVWKDSTTLFYTSDCNGAMNIFQMNLLDNQPHQITRSLTGNLDIQYIPQNNSLLYTGLNRGSYQIFYRSLDQTPASSSSTASPPLSFNRDPLESRYPEWNRSMSWKRYSDSSRISQIETGHYKTRLSMDIAQSSVTYDPVIGTSGGIQFLFSDMLGNTQNY
ncbi:MAG: PD40 domain-containing protein, partial [Candidatus Delongbacteria bacterium]|nr:PD40 domain-containing protein [Candidatus Delongbacteria bacterium]